MKLVNQESTLPVTVIRDKSEITAFQPATTGGVSSKGFANTSYVILNDQIAAEPRAAREEFLNELDVVGYNYVGRWRTRAETYYDEDKRKHPSWCMIGTENSGLGGMRGRYLFGMEEKAGWWMCPYYSAPIEVGRLLRYTMTHDYVAGDFMWTGIDYLGEAHGWPIHGSGAGLMTMAGFEKTGYYRRQSLWSSIPMIHLATIAAEDSCRTSWGETSKQPIDCEFAPVSECWDYVQDEEVVVKCYTNLPQVELILNGKTLGTYDKDEEKDCILVTLPFAPGELKATGVGVHQRISDTLHSTGSPCQMSAEVYQPEKDTPAENLTYVSELTNGRNLYQIAITLLDSNGHRSYQASSMLQVQVVGGRLLGLENGDLADVTEYTANYRRAYHGELIAYVQAMMLARVLRGDLDCYPPFVWR